MSKDHKDQAMGIFLVTDKVGKQTFIKAGHSETIFQMDSTGADPVGAVHGKRPEATGWIRQLIAMETPLPDGIAAKVCAHMPKHLLRSQRWGQSTHSNKNRL
jgi:hypothetical protein